MARTQRTAKSWLFILGMLWLAFFGAVVIVMITQGTGPLGVFGFAADDEDPNDADVMVSATNGWFSEDQANRGSSEYDQHCAVCHGAALDGGTGPALAGDQFWNRWGGESVHTLYQVSSQTMPPDNPGSLDDQTYIDIVAFILHTNSFPAGDQELPPGDEEHLQGLTIEEATTEDVTDDPDEPGVGLAEDGVEEPEADPDDPGEPAVDAEARAEERTEEPDEAAADETEAEEAPADTDADATDEDEPTEPEEPADAAEQPAEVEAPGGPRSEDDEEGWFTETQVNAGEDAYAQHCARCHGVDLQGNPPLVGGGFPERYTTVLELYEYTRAAMPLDAPGSLDRQTYADVIAYVLHENGYPTGEERLEPVRAQMRELRLDRELADDPPAEEAEEEAPEEEAPEEEAPEDADENANDENGAAESDDADTENDEAENDEAANDEAANDEAAADATQAWFSDEQADRGADEYAQHCAQCHGDDLQGNP
ncbi:MAG: cytochrome c, partial [Trueperaceae bacterium]|nr:cytochrome c [Trueperaceae bacterium]